jgi:hypothetical protein
MVMVCPLMPYIRHEMKSTQLSGCTRAAVHKCRSVSCTCRYCRPLRLEESDKEWKFEQDQKDSFIMVLPHLGQILSLLVWRDMRTQCFFSFGRKPRWQLQVYTSACVIDCLALDVMFVWMHVLAQKQSSAVFCVFVDWIWIHFGLVAAVCNADRRVSADSFLTQRGWYCHRQSS